MPELSYLTAFIVGLLGGGHCIGMCGGIIGALTLGLQRERHRSIAEMLPYQFAYNLGRVVSYTAAGALMGALGMLLAEVLPLYLAQRALLVLAGLFMLLLGLYLSGWWLLLSRLEALGGLLWRRIEPLGRRLFPVRTPGQALLLGLVWGWIPCGLVYSMLVNAVATGSVLRGALVMLAFALGTLPTLITIGVLTGVAARLAGSSGLRTAAGVLVMLFGAVTLWRAF